jgi:hypothetical protein
VSSELDDDDDDDDDDEMNAGRTKLSESLEKIDFELKQRAHLNEDAAHRTASFT